VAEWFKAAVLKTGYLVLEPKQFSNLGCGRRRSAGLVGHGRHGLSHPFSHQSSNAETRREATKRVNS
jgi:hypothetical protein